MYIVESEEFEKMVAKAIDEIPEKYYAQVKNVAFVSEDEPSAAQRSKLKLRNHQSLYGLYEGIPLTKRSSGYNMVLPDKITVFRIPTMLSANTYDELQILVNQTVWHEVAHYFGLDHDQIHKLESK